MSDTIITLNNKTNPMNIKYVKSPHGFSDSHFNSTKYLFELIIKGETNDNTTVNLAEKQSFSGTKYFRSLEDNKYSHLIKLNHMIKLKDIKSYTATLTIIPSDLQHNFELEGIINKNESSSTQRSMNMYIEFTQNDMGNAMCSCFYTGLDHNKIFASPPI